MYQVKKEWLGSTRGHYFDCSKLSSSIKFSWALEVKFCCVLQCEWRRWFESQSRPSILSFPYMLFNNWDMVDDPSHHSWKEKPRPLISVHYSDVKSLLFNGTVGLTCSTLRKDCQSWLLLRMGVATSTVLQIFKHAKEEILYWLIDWKKS